MTKLAFFYCTGTAYTMSIFNNQISAQSTATGRWFWGDTVINPGADPQVKYVTGLGGKLYPWSGEVFEDPFPYMLDPEVWDAQRVPYSAASITFLSGGQLIGGMGASINDGVQRVIDKIKALPPGQPFALGGYSQGAAVMSSVYNELRSGSLTSRYPNFVGGVMFGNPRRQVNHRGEIGGTWSGAWDIPGSNEGGHGSFPATGSHPRLSGCDGTEWIEFAAPDDIITSTGDSTLGARWTQGNDALISLLSSQYAGKVLLQAIVESIFPAIANPVVEAIEAAFGISARLNHFIDPTGIIGSMAGAGHVIYPQLGPPSSDGIVPSIAETVTTTFTLGGSTTSNARYASRRGKVPQTFSALTYDVTKTYLKANGDTCYQLALKWLEDKAKAYATSPILIPSTGKTGWATTLVPPAS